MTAEGDGEVYRVEAEVESEDYAKILRNTIQRAHGCTLTAFDVIEVEDAE